MSRNRTRRRGKTKADLVAAVYRRHGGLTKVEAAEVVETILDKMRSTLADGHAVKITNFGTFEVTQRPARRGVNPASGERIRIPAHRGLSFRPARRLMETVSRQPSSAREHEKRERRPSGRGQRRRSAIVEGR